MSRISTRMKMIRIQIIKNRIMIFIIFICVLIILIRGPMFSHRRQFHPFSGCRCHFR